MIGIRKVVFYGARTMFYKRPPFKKESDVYPLELDEKIRKARLKKMKPIEGIRKVK